MMKELTEQSVCEAIPHATTRPNKPPSLCAGGEAERSSEHAHQHIAQRYINQQEINGGTQQFVATKQNQHHQVVEESKTSYEAQTYCNHQVSSRA